MKEPLPLATIHDAVLEFLRGRDDAVLFGAQAVNAYVDESRMTQDVDILSTRAAELAEEICTFLNQRFHIAVQSRRTRRGGFCVDQIRTPANRHLIDVQQVREFPPTRRVRKVKVVSPAEVIAGKVCIYHSRRTHPDSGLDRRDLAHLLLVFPELKTETGPVLERLQAAGAGDDVFATWRELVAQEIKPPQEDDEFN